MKAMSILYLHIGAQKTGSTYIQSSLRMSREALANAGLIYPPGTEKTGLGPQSWTGGNAATVFDDPNTARRVIDAAMRQHGRGLVLSSEALLSKLAKDSTRKMLQESIDRHRFNEIRVLIYLRDPMQGGVSYWLQKVKGYGMTDELDDFLRNTRFIQKRMALTAEVLEYLSGQEGFGIRALNYSAHRSDILSSVSAWLEVDRGILATPDVERVNRSLTQGEARLQLELNRILGPYASFLGKALTERITDLDAEKPTPSPELQESIWKEVEPWVNRVNRFLPDGQGLVFDRMESKEYAEGYVFTEEQIRIIAETLGGEIKKYWDSESKMMRLIRRLTGSFWKKTYEPEESLKT
jgi:hypothetical protein